MNARTFREPGAFPVNPQTAAASVGPRGRSSAGVKRSKSYGTARRCAGGCGATVSEYNPDDVCRMCDQRARRATQAVTG